MFFKNTLDIYEYVPIKNEYGDNISFKKFKENIACTILDVELVEDFNNSSRFIKVITETKIKRDSIFYYDLDLFKVKTYKKYKNFYVILCEMIADV